MTTRKERGLENLRAISGEVGIKAVEKLADTSLELANFITEFAFGDIYSLKALSKRDQVLITLSSLISQGEIEALKVHFHSAHNIGLTEDEIKNIIIHCVPYAGFPKAIRAMQMYEEVLNDDTYHNEASQYVHNNQ